MTERTFSPKIIGHDGEVVIELPGGIYLRMPAEDARTFAGRMLQAANKAEGNDPAHMFVFKVES